MQGEHRKGWAAPFKFDSGKVMEQFILKAISRSMRDISRYCLLRHQWSGWHCLPNRESHWTPGNAYRHSWVCCCCLFICFVGVCFCWVFLLLTVWVTAHWHKLLREIVESPSLGILLGHGLRQLHLDGSAWAEGLDQMTCNSPFHTHLFSDFVVWGP